MFDLNRARNFLAYGEQDKAAQELAGLLHAEPKNIDAWLLMAELSEETVHKRDCYRQVQKLDPDNEHARLQLEMMGLKSGRKIEMPTSGPHSLAESIRSLRSDYTAPEPELVEEVEEKPPVPFRERIKALAVRVKPVADKLRKKFHPRVHISRPVWIILAVLAGAILLAAFYGVFDRVIPSRTPSGLIVGPPQQYFPDTADLPAGFNRVEKDSHALNIPSAESYQVAFTNPSFATQERETEVFYSLKLYANELDAETDFQMLSIPDTAAGGDPVETHVIAPQRLMRTQSAALFYVMTGKTKPPSIRYILIFRRVNLLCTVSVSAPVDAVNSVFADRLRSPLYQAVFYYASLVTARLPVPSIEQVSVSAPEFSTPAPAQPTQALRVTSLPTSDSLWRDHFYYDSVSAQTTWKIVSGEWSIASNRFICKAAKTACLALAGSPAWSGYTFSVEVQALDGVEKLVYFGVVEGKKAYLVRFRSDPYNEVMLVEQRAGKADREIRKVTFKNYNRQIYRVQVALKGKTIKVFVDSLLVMEVTDPQIESLDGQIGLGLLPNAGAKDPVAGVSFDDVQVILK